MHNNPRKQTIHERCVLFLAEPLNAFLVLLATAIVGLAVVAITAASASRTAPEGCTVHTVQRGDIASRVAANNKVRWSDFERLNWHIADLNRIWPGDELVTACDKPAEPAAHVEPAAVPVELERRLDGNLTPRGIAQLAATQWDGDDLVIAVAVALAESGGIVGAEGDINIQNGTWGPSVGVWQVRSLWAQRGSGGPRDLDRLSDPTFNVEAARSIFDSSIAARGHARRWHPWGAFTNGSYQRHMATARAAVESIGGAR
jgi:hypothetical protein